MKDYPRAEALDDTESSVHLLQSNPDLALGVDFSSEAIRLEGLGYEHHDTYQKTAALEDLESAIQSFQKAVDFTPDNHPDKARRLQSLSVVYRDRYNQIQTLDDLDTSIQLCQKILELTPQKDHDRAFRLESLGIGLQDRYQITKTIEDLHSAICQLQEAVDLTPKNNPDRVQRLQELGTVYRDLYEQTRVIDDLQLSIERLQEAFDLMPEDHPERVFQLRDLESAYDERYQRTMAEDDLRFISETSQMVVDLTSEVDPYRYFRLHELGLISAHRYQRTKAYKHLEFAIQKYKEALDLMPNDHPERAYPLLSLGRAYLSVYSSTWQPEYLQRAIQILREALDCSPENRIDRSDFLHGLSQGYLQRYLKTKVVEHLDYTINTAQEAVDLALDNDSHRANKLAALAFAYELRHQRTRALDDLGFCNERYHEALCHTNSYLEDRLDAGRELFAIHVRAEDWSSASDVASLTLSLIPLLIPRSLERSDIQYRIKDVAEFASNAAAIALKAGKSVPDVIQFLEVGRGIVAGSLSDTRTDITHLFEEHPHLAGQFENLRGLLDTPKESRKDKQRYSNGRQLERLLEEIRNLPGFDRFLLVPGEDELKQAAIYGPVIIVNVSSYGCHALIIEQKEFRALELPLLDIRDVQAKVKDLASPDIEMLEWLWVTVAYPVITSLQFGQPSESVWSLESVWPRVWWIPTGPLMQFPIHAAGYYSDGTAHDTVMDRVISSYSSSLKAINSARNNLSTSKNTHKPESMVLVGMEDTPGYSSLQFVSKEIEILTSVGASMQLEVKKPVPYQDETISALRGCRVFHFAGHGYTDSADPSKSALILKDGKLTVESIFDINLHQDKPFLAYLSACGTGRVKHDRLIDEGLHLIGACQLAGFQHVIGTLWDVNDRSCVDVARKTYEWMKKQNLSNNCVSEGLHHACRELRSEWIKENNLKETLRRSGNPDKNLDVSSNVEQSYSTQKEKRNVRDGEMDEDLPLHWVPYVHFGT